MYGRPISQVFALLNSFGTFWHSPHTGPSNTGWIYKIHNILPNRPCSTQLGRNQRCHNCFLPWKTIPLWNLCFPQRLSPPVSHMLTPMKPSMKIYCCCFACSDNTQSVSDGKVSCCLLRCGWCQQKLKWTYEPSDSDASSWSRWINRFGVVTKMSTTKSYKQCCKAQQTSPHIQLQGAAT